MKTKRWSWGWNIAPCENKKAEPKKVNFKFRFKKQGKRKGVCQMCKKPIYEGELCVVFDYITNIFNNPVQAKLCLCCILTFVKKSVPNVKNYGDLIKELRIRKVAKEL